MDIICKMVSRHQNSVETKERLRFRQQKSKMTKSEAYLRKMIKQFILSIPLTHLNLTQILWLPTITRRTDSILLSLLRFLRTKKKLFALSTDLKRVKKFQRRLTDLELLVQEWKRSQLPSSIMKSIVEIITDLELLGQGWNPNKYRILSRKHQ